LFESHFEKFNWFSSNSPRIVSLLNFTEFNSDYTFGFNFSILFPSQAQFLIFLVSVRSNSIIILLMRYYNLKTSRYLLWIACFITPYAINLSKKLVFAIEIHAFWLSGKELVFNPFNIHKHSTHSEKMTKFLIRIQFSYYDCLTLSVRNPDNFSKNALYRVMKKLFRIARDRYDGNIWFLDGE